MTTEREYALALREQGGSLEAASRLLKEQSRDRYLFTGEGLSEVIWRTIIVAQELIQVEAEIGLRGMVGAASWKSPLKSETGLKETIRELSR